MATIEKQIKNKVEEEDEEVEVSDVEDVSDAEEDDAEESDASEAVESDAEESDPEESDIDPEAEEDPEEDPSEIPQKKESKRTTVVNGIEMLKATKKSQPIIYEEDDDDEDEEDDVNYLQKFDSTMRENFILNHHPEARTHNYEEVKALTRVSRDGRGIIIDPLHKTIPFLTKYEMTRVIGQRAKQLDSGARPFVKVPLNVIDGYLIALLELEQKKLPFIIKRPYPNGGVEYWNVSDLELLL
jgi:DNA-directed RNA polymerase subunit K/omega